MLRLGAVLVVLTLAIQPSLAGYYTYSMWAGASENERRIYISLARSTA
jgi:hypothetical protein